MSTSLYHSPDPAALKLAQSVFRLFDALEIGPDEAAGILNLSKRAFNRLSGNPMRLPLDCLRRMTDALHVPVESILNGTVDLPQVRRWRLGDYTLPLRYVVGSGSRTRTFLPVLRYLANDYRPRAPRHLLRRLGVHPNSIADPSALVSIHLLNDACSLLASQGFSALAFREMGLRVPDLPENLPLYRVFSSARNQKELWELFVGELSGAYDSNFYYRISEISSKHVIVDISARAEVQGKLGVHHLASSWVQFYRQGVAMAHSKYIGRKISPLEELANVRQGAKSDVYRLTW